MGNVYSLPLPPLTVNKGLIREFLSEDPPCFALGMIEERTRHCGFLALRPDEAIPREVSDLGFRFGHTMLGTKDFPIIQFLFRFYGFRTYTVLVNPNNPVVRTVLRTMVESGDYYFIEIGPDSTATVFRSEIGAENLAGLTTNLPMIMSATTTNEHYGTAVSLYRRKGEPEGVLLNWVCRDNMEYLDLSKDRLLMTPRE